MDHICIILWLAEHGSVQFSQDLARRLFDFNFRLLPLRPALRVTALTLRIAGALLLHCNMMQIGKTVLWCYGLGEVNGRTREPEYLVRLRIAIEMAHYKRINTISVKMVVKRANMMTDLSLEVTSA